MSNLSQLLDDVYSALDNGQYEKALQLCLKPEVNRFTLGKALLSYTYACLRNNSKAMEVARMVASADPSEESVISTLGCTFKHIRAESDFANLYETAMKKKALPESYVIELFSCYCRLNDPKKMQFVAQKLHKSTPDKNHFLFWSITCMMLQDLPPTMMVLAEKMAFKVLYELSPLTQPSAEEMSLYALILAKQNKLTQAFDAIVQLRGRATGSPLVDEAHFAANPNFVKMLGLQVSVHKIDLLMRQGRLEEAIHEGKHVLASFPDQWNVHSVMVDCLLQRTTGSTINQEGVQALSREKHMDFPMQDLSALLRKVSNQHPASSSDVASLSESVLQYHSYLQQLQSQHPKLRGPYLAEMHLLASWIALLQDAPTVGEKPLWVPSEASAMPQGAQAELAASALGGLVLALCDLIGKFALRFQTKQCCFSDLKPYLTALSSTAHSQTALTALRAWAVEQRILSNQRLFEAVSVVTDAKARTGAPQKDATAQLSPAVTNPTSFQPPAPPTAVEEAEEGGEDVEEAGTAGKDAATGASASAAPSAGGKKKKNKKKKKASSTVAAATAALSAVELAEKQKQAVEEFTEVLLPLCAFIKIDQIVAYCDTLLIERGFVCSDNHSREEDEELWLRLAVYAASREIFGKGVGGEARNVQPGDELVLQNSSLYRRRFVDTRSQAFAQSHGVAVQWAKTLQAGLLASPYGSAFKADVLEPYRALAMGEAAAKSYTDMGPRHIQHDSLSYLIFPTLLETACFTEAAKNMRAVVNHHMAGRRDSLDMMGRAFQYGNYMRALELSRFVDVCHRSTQLRVCKAELPIVEVILKHPSLASATKYLGDLMENRLPESLELQETEQQAGLVDHMDFSLQVRTDQLDGERAADTARMCRLQMLQRLAIAQRTTRMLFYATLREGDEAMEHFEELQRCLATAVPTSCSPAHPYQLWDQSVSRGDGAFGAALAEVSAQTTRFLLACIATNTAAMLSPPSSSSSAVAADKAKPAGFLSLESAAASALSAVTALFSLREAAQSTPLFLDGSEDKLVSPQWLRNATAFVRTAGTELALLVQVSAGMHSSVSSFRDSCGAQASLADCEALLRAHTAPTHTAEAQLGALVAITSEVFISVLDLVHSRVQHTNARLAAVSLSEFSAAVAAISNGAVCPPPSSAVVAAGPTQAQYEEARRAMAASVTTSAPTQQMSSNAPLVSKSFADSAELHGLVSAQLSSSHREACARLAGLLQERIDAVRTCLQ